MNILDGLRFKRSQTLVATSTELLASTVALGGVKLVTSIADAIDSKDRVKHSQLLNNAFTKIERQARFHQAFNQDKLQEEEKSLLGSLGEYVGRKLLFGAMTSLARMFMRGASVAIRVGARLLSFVGRAMVRTLGFMARGLLLANPIALGVTVAAAVGYVGYKGYQHLQEKELSKSLALRAMEAGISSPKELAAFMGQMSHESAGFSRLVEGTYSPENVWRLRGTILSTQGITFADVKAAYASGGENAMYELMYGGRLGNTQAGEGAKYRGRGFIQLTGKDNYAAMGKKIGVDLVNNPDLAADPDIAARIAIQYWKDRGIGNAALAGDTELVTKLINGGLIGLEDRAARTAEWERHFAENGMPTKDGVDIANATTAEGFISPMAGPITSHSSSERTIASLGLRAKHEGIDIGAPVGTSVYASNSGVVIRADGNDRDGYGNLVVIKGDNGYYTWYAHLSAFKVKVGDRVSQGALLGLSGGGVGVEGAGRTTGAHLHFGVSTTYAASKGGSNFIAPESVLAARKRETEDVASKSSTVVTPEYAPVVIQKDGELLKRGSQLTRLRG